MGAGVMGAFRLTAHGQRVSPANSHRQASTANGLDLSKAVVIAPRTLSVRERKAVVVLVEEVERRTEFRWPIVEHLSPEPSAVVVGSRQALTQIRGELPGNLLPASGPAMAPEAWLLC